MPASPKCPLEDFSSQGPTTDGRTKPDIVGPDRVTNLWTQTVGTSFAAPHVAGAAALLLEQDPMLMPQELAAQLESMAFDVGDEGKDDLYGAGELQVEVLPGGAFDSDGDGYADIPDNCAYVFNPAQLDTGMVGGPGMDGIGDVCQCGDLTVEGAVDAVDLGVVRVWLAGFLGSLPQPERCNVRGAADGGLTDCDLVDVVVLKRALDPEPLAPGVQQACSPAQP